MDTSDFSYDTHPSRRLRGCGGRGSGPFLSSLALWRFARKGGHPEEQHGTVATRWGWVEWAPAVAAYAVCLERAWETTLNTQTAAPAHV